MTQDALALLVQKFVKLAAVVGPHPDQGQVQDATHRLIAELHLLPEGTDRLRALFEAVTTGRRPQFQLSFDAHIDRVLSNIKLRRDE